MTITGIDGKVIAQLTMMLSHVIEEQLIDHYDRWTDIIEAVMGLQSMLVALIAGLGIIIGLIVVYIIIRRW